MEKSLAFTVDSRLLEELGERLVGKPATALAELVKNSYDADATVVEIILDRSDSGRIEVRDNGHGMTLREFQDYWMRLGSQHKRELRVSRNFNRPFTGSKGVGRIAAQLLSEYLRIESVSDQTPGSRLIADLDWREAIESGDLVDAKVRVREEQASADSEPGTTLVLKNLRQQWSEDRVEQLAQQIWQLQPPFGRAAPRESAGAKDFKVIFSGPEEHLVEAFDSQMQVILQLWAVKAVGVNRGGKAKISLQFKGEDPRTYSFQVDDARLENGRFELRFYELRGRQPHGIKVSTAREYLDEFGGVHIYDTGFRLPFYGEKDNDWLLISYDMSRRTTLSSLLPKHLQVARGMLSLPQWNQVLGMVEISTAEEPDLEVTITRDRLVESKAFRQLRDFVRRAIHWYANEKARRRLVEGEAAGEHERPSARVSQTLEVLQRYRDDIPEEVALELQSTLNEARKETRRHEWRARRQIGALSSFATAGIAALGYHHELNKQLLAIEDLAEELGTVLDDPQSSEARLQDLRKRLLHWIRRARQTGRIFSHLADPENIEDERRFNVRSLVTSVAEQIEPLRREIRVDLTELDSQLRLPKGTYTEWVSVFQNAFFNSLNSMVDSEEKVLRVRSDAMNKTQHVVIEDTGSGVDLSKAEQYFEPFERDVTISPERQQLGFGGTGLGLTIIRMISEQRGVKVHFSEPSDGYSTALVLEWEERQ